MTDEENTNLLELDAVEYAASIGFVAAGQLFAVLTKDPKSAGDWIGSHAIDEGYLEQHVYELANYVVSRGIGGQTLWLHAKIDGILAADIPESGSFADAPLPRQWAYDMFAIVVLHAHKTLSAMQGHERAALTVALQAKAHVPLKLEDSIFDPGKPMSYQEPHQAQFLADQAELDRRRQEAEALQTEADSVSAGQPLETIIEPPAAPAAISVGQQPGDENAQETAEDGQGAGGEVAADPDAQGEISGLDDDAAHDGDVSDGEVLGSEAGDQEPDTAQVLAPGELEQPVEEQPDEAAAAAAAAAPAAGKAVKAKPAN